jgi:hypothetical protein
VILPGRPGISETPCSRPFTIAVVVRFLGILAVDSNDHSNAGGQVQFAIELAMLARLPTLRRLGGF